MKFAYIYDKNWESPWFTRRTKLIRSDSIHAIRLTFEHISLGKVLNLFSPQLWLKSYHYYPSTGMVLALNRSQLPECY